MKRTTLLFISILIGFISFAQNNTKYLTKSEWQTIPAGTQQIVINNTANSTDNFNHVSELLIDNNFEINKHDLNMGTISTEFMPLDVGTYKLKIRCKSNKIIITGLWTSGVSIELYGVRSETSLTAIEKHGMRKSMYGLSFAAMQNFAKQLGTITYQQ